MPTVADAMITEIQVLAADATPAELREFFANDRVHAALLVTDGRLAAVVTRGDLDSKDPKGSLTGRTVGPDEDAHSTLERMQNTGQRRLAVVDADGRLLGLLALKRSRTGFCTHADLAARRADRTT